jgi:selT/selW/selH-like putative selenoprotein
VTPELVSGGGGIFDVHLDGELVYSKFESGGFPNEMELVGKLKGCVRTVNRRSGLSF